MGHMRAEQQSKGIEKELRGAWLRLHGRNDHLRHPVQHGIDAAMYAFERLNPSGPQVVGERIEQRAWNVIVDPIDRTRVSCTGIRLQVVDANASGRPLFDS